MSSGSPSAVSVLHRFRRNERRLARWALGLFCVVWLQLAISPCRAVHAMPVDGHAHDRTHQTAEAAHETQVAAPAAAHADCGNLASVPDSVPPGPDRQGDEPCPWCPSAGHAGHAEAGSRCAFPHAPQVDSRLPPPFLPPVVAPAFPSKPPTAGYVLYTAKERPDAVPRRSFSVSYCRYLE
jgi:hypothetical protein